MYFRLISSFNFLICFHTEDATFPPLAKIIFPAFIEYLKDLFSEIHPNKRIDYIEYKKRFINQQRWIYMNNKIEKVHPCVCLETDNFNNFDMITFTPHDCIRLYEEIDDIFDEIYEDDEELEDRIDTISPDKYFTEENYE